MKSLIKSAALEKSISLCILGGLFALNVYVSVQTASATPVGSEIVLAFAE